MTKTKIDAVDKDEVKRMSVSWPATAGTLHGAITAAVRQLEAVNQTDEVEYITDFLKRHLAQYELAALVRSTVAEINERGGW